MWFILELKEKINRNCFVCLYPYVSFTCLMHLLSLLMWLFVRPLMCLRYCFMVALYVFRSVVFSASLTFFLTVLLCVFVSLCIFLYLIFMSSYVQNTELDMYCKRPHSQTESFIFKYSSSFKAWGQSFTHVPSNYQCELSSTMAVCGHSRKRPPYA